MRRKKISQKKNTSHNMYDRNFNAHNILTDSCLYNNKNEVKKLTVNKMLLVLIFLMVK